MRPAAFCAVALCLLVAACGSDEEESSSPTTLDAPAAVAGYTGTITLPDGSTVPYELFDRGGRLTPEAIAGMGTPRTIILVDGSSRGILDPIAKQGKAKTT